jgi:RNase P protein component
LVSRKFVIRVVRRPRIEKRVRELCAHGPVMVIVGFAFVLT